jgi:hypothetical protein
MADSFLGFHTIYGDEGERRTSYMTRVWIGRLRFHVFHRGDADPDCHDHPWDFWTFPLTSYVEEVAEPIWMSGPLPMQYHLRRQLVRAFRLHYRPATHCHRVVGRSSGQGLQTENGRIYTLVWRGSSGRAWGFLKNRDGQWCWTPWRDYILSSGKNVPCAPSEGGDA